ncbi:MAG: hypothetical protein FJ399_18285, partial [Verrucomicrobia bacterium]|nr:hypothetical protein [Verrucomicrobiota bacterium]
MPATLSLHPSGPLPFPQVALLRAAGCAASLAVSAEARRWFALAIGSLVVAGLLSLAVVLGRIPGVSGVIDDPLFFKRCLVVHVDLALVVWFYAFLGGLAAVRSAPARGAMAGAAYALALGGTVAMLAGALMRGA